jgi:hypothetical protein
MIMKNEQREDEVDGIERREEAYLASAIFIEYALNFMVQFAG